MLPRCCCLPSLPVRRQVTVHSVYCTTAVLRMRARRSAALLARAFEAWSGHSRGVAGAAAKLVYAVQVRVGTSKTYSCGTLSPSMPPCCNAATAAF